MNPLKLLITLFAILHIGVGCSSVQKENLVEVLPFATGNNAYQVRVKTGNVAMDKVVYSLAYSEMGKHLKVSETGPFIGYIDVTFESSIKKPFRDSRSSFSMNRLYGNKWYTGKSNFDQSNIPAEIKQGGLLAWQNSVMSLTIRDINGKKKWNNVCNYKGGRDLSGFKIDTADKAAVLCLNRITMQFRSDYNIKKKNEKWDPGFALILKGKDSGKWKYLGKTPDGKYVYIHAEIISYPAGNIVRVPVKTSNIEKAPLELYEIDCKQNRFRVLDQRFDISISKHTIEWSLISPLSTPELVYNSVCLKN